MLRISKKADYAVFLLGYLARHGAYPGGPAEDSVVSAQEMANSTGLNKSVVANLLKEFTKEGLLESVRGLKGGYRLTAAPEDISLSRILRVVDGPFSLVECIQPLAGPVAGKAPAEPDPHRDEDGQCSLIGFCPSKSPMHLVHERIAHLFQQIRLDELCGLSAPALPFPSLSTARR